jgi:hypothetical protein
VPGPRTEDGPLFPDYSGPTDPETTYRASWGRPGIPPALAEVLKTRLETAPGAGLGFLRRVLRRYLVEGLLVPEAAADRFVARVTGERLADPQCFLRWLKLEKGVSAETPSIMLLLKLADVEPDWLVKSALPDAPDPTLLAPWLERHSDSIPLMWNHIRACLSLRHSSATPFLVRALAAEENAYRLDDYLPFFLDLGDDANAAAVVDRAVKLLQGRTPKFRANRIDDLIECAREAGDKGRAVLERLEALRAAVPR